MTKTAYLSGLGTMGRRHLNGLVSRGIRVTAFDPSEESRTKAKADLDASGFDSDMLTFTDDPAGHSFEIAIFCEVAHYRMANVKRFIERAEASRFLLEKPLSAAPKEVDKFPILFEAYGIDPDLVAVNMLRRTWAYVDLLKSQADASPQIHMTINGGAFGFGCNGIHLIDLFLYFADRREADVVFSKLDPTEVGSGRGANIKDFGGRFLVENDRGSFYCNASATSSAGMTFTITGEHFMAWVDETDLRWRLSVRKPDSKLPFYRCGHEYEIQADGVAAIDDMSTSTGKWAAGELTLPNLNDALPTHRLLHSILEAGGAQPPYHYT